MEPTPGQYSNEEFEFRYLQESDYHLGVFEVLSELTKAPKPSLEEFTSYWNVVASAKNKHINVVGLQRQSQTIVAFGTILITSSVLNGKVGKIENIVTSKSVRGKGLGKSIILALKSEGEKERCNKVTLFCEQKNTKFYEKLGFKPEGSIFAAYKV